MPETFAPDPRVQQVAEAYALDAVDFAKTAFGIRLDWSDDSVRHVESMLARLHEEAPAAQPDDDKILGFAKMLGSYVGEVLRKNHGATWGMATLQGEPFPGMKAANADRLFWPWIRAQKRIVNGEESNMWHYYQLLTGHGQIVTGGPAPEPPTSSTPPWWKRVFRG